MGEWKQLKVGDLAKRVMGHNGPNSRLGHVAVIKRIEWNRDVPTETWVWFEDGSSGYLASFVPCSKPYDPEQQPWDEDDV